MARYPIAETAAKGDRLATLEALRGRLATAIDGCNDARDLAALTLRLQRVLSDIAELGGQAKDEENDDLAARRDAKLSAAGGS